MKAHSVTMIMIVVVACWAVAGCSRDGAEVDADPPGGSDAGCGTCEDEMAQVRQRVEKLEGVTEVADLVRGESSPTNGDFVDVQVRSSDADNTGLADRLARIVWDSEVVPLDYVTVTVQLADQTLVTPRPYNFRSSGDRASYVEKWGERPVE